MQKYFLFFRVFSKESSFISLPYVLTIYVLVEKFLTILTYSQDKKEHLIK